LKALTSFSEADMQAAYESMDGVEGPDGEEESGSESDSGEGSIDSDDVPLAVLQKRMGTNNAAGKGVAV
jgi:hypothetical protein